MISSTSSYCSCSQKSSKLTLLSILSSSDSTSSKFSILSTPSSAPSSDTLNRISFFPSISSASIPYASAVSFFCNFLASSYRENSLLLLFSVKYGLIPSYSGSMFLYWLHFCWRRTSSSRVDARQSNKRRSERSPATVILVIISMRSSFIYSS